MASLLDFCLEHGFEKTYWIAYSGGLDSHVLLHFLAKLREHHPLKLKAIHIHHGLSSHADSWVEHCAQICSELKIDFIFRKIFIDTSTGNSLEDIARQRRYAVFSELLAENDLLLTAHHQNDQAETVFLQLLRGAGPKGLAAMPRIKKLGLGLHARPLLDLTREELKHYARQWQLKWIEDESNVHINYTRNFLRHHILPLLQERWPTVNKTLARVAENCADMQQVLELLIQNDLIAAKGSVLHTLSVTYLKQLPPARQRLVLREWLHQCHFPLPSAKKMQQILIDILCAREDKSPCIQWGNVELRRYQDDVYVRSIPVEKKRLERFLWNIHDPLIILGVGTLYAIPTQGQGLKKNIEQLTIRFRQGGEQIRLPGRTFSHSLKKLFQEWKIPPWSRDSVPLVYSNDELVAVVGFAIGDGFMVGVEEEGYLLELVVST